LNPTPTKRFKLPADRKSKRDVSGWSTFKKSKNHSMEEHLVKVTRVEQLTHDVMRIVTEKPPGYVFIPGQATSISLNTFGWRKTDNPFTFTSLPSDNHLEFTIKTYPARKGLTNELVRLEKNDEIIIHEVFGAIAYKGEGTFIAGGAGITPFISILRNLHSRNEIGDNKLLFSNKAKEDIILKEELSRILGNNFVNILSVEETKDFEHGRITESFLRANCKRGSGYFYLCGPPPMMDELEKQLAAMKIDPKMIVKEVF
jgi:ferredoxin-NADP reductase